jgi:hypothetical protein
MPDGKVSRGIILISVFYVPGAILGFSASLEAGVYACAHVKVLGISFLVLERASATEFRPLFQPPLIQDLPIN